ncbi:MAG TPA: glycosyl transferase family 2, partial [Archangium sp.]
LVVGFLGFIYRMETRHLPADRRVSGAWFMPMALMMPVTYALFTPLALFTLDSGSWETRGKPSAAPGVPPESAPPPDGTPETVAPTQAAGGGSTP